MNEIKKQLVTTHLFLINEIRHSERSDLNVNAPFQHKYPFQNQKTKNSFPILELKTQEEAERLPKKLLEKEPKKVNGLQAV